MNLKGESLIIRADANTQIGSGHLMRCLALAQAWKDAGGRVIFVTACKSDGLLQRLREEDFDIHPLAHPHPDAADLDFTKNILSTGKDAWVVLDGYHFDEVYQQWIKEMGHRLLVIDDMAHLKHYYADIVLNQNLHAEQLHYSCEPYTRLLLGTRYVLLRREFLAWRDWKREIPEVARRVLVTLGGADPENHTLKVIQALRKVDVPDLQTTVVIGASNPHIEVLEAAAKQSSVPIRLIRNVAHMPDLMAWADVAVSAAGSTVWELLFMGTPTLCLTMADNQRYIAEYVETQGLGENPGWAKNVSTEALTQAIISLLKDSGLRVKMSRKARRLVDGQGAQRVLEMMTTDDKVFAPTDGKVNLLKSLEGRDFKVVFLGGRQAGCIGLLTAMAAGCKIQAVVAYDEMLQKLAEELGVPLFSSVKEAELNGLLSKTDLLLSVHCPEIIPEKQLDLPCFGGINVHPCLYRYKGAHPVDRLLRDGATRASVGVHRMTEHVDEGEVLVEEFVDVAGKQTVESVYNVLYPYYALALLKALRILRSLGVHNH